MKLVKTNSGIKGKIKYELGVMLGNKNKGKIVALIGILRHPFYRIKMLKHINELHKRNMPNNIMSPGNAAMWKRNFYKIVLTTYEKRYGQIVDAFYDTQLICIKTMEILKDEPVVIGAVRDDLIKIRRMIEHHRSLGVKCFAFIDNGSIDGTKEFLMAQDDVILYETKNDFNSRRKAVWINYVITQLGLNRWYLMLDSDECAVYPHYEKISLKEYTQKLSQRGITAVKSLMLEMYPNGNLFTDKNTDDNFLEEYCWFDGDSDYYEYEMERRIVEGGLHLRVFDIKGSLRTKVSLFFAEQGRFPVGPHDLFPEYENIDARYGMILLHYKFLQYDMSKIDRIIEEKSYAHGSAYYKQYKNTFEHMDNVTMFYEGSVQWKGTESFKEFPIIEDLWAE